MTPIVSLFAAPILAIALASSHLAAAEPALTGTVKNFERATSPTGARTNVTSAGPATTTSLTDTGLTPGATYYYWVKTVLDDGRVSADSTQASVTMSAQAPDLTWLWILLILIIAVILIIALIAMRRRKKPAAAPPATSTYEAPPAVESPAEGGGGGAEEPGGGAQ